MNVSYKRDMTHNYLVPEVMDKIFEDDYRIHMLMENHIQGLLPCSLRRINCQSRFFYDITSRQSMEQVYGKIRMRADDIRLLLRGLHRALCEIKKYLLDMDRIVLEPQMIYMDIESKEPFFCYLPCYEKDIMQSFRELSMYLLERLDHSDQQAVLLGYEIYRRAKEDNDSLEKILQDAGTPAQMREMDGAKTSFEPERSIRRNMQREPVYEKPKLWNAEEMYQSQANRQSEEGYKNPAGRKEKEAYKSPNHVQQEEFYKNTMDWNAEEAYQNPTLWQTGEARQEEKPKKRKKLQKKKELQQAGKEKTAASGRLFLIVCFGVAIALLAMAAWFWKLTATQTGGVAFLLAAILAYGCTLDEKKKKNADGAKDAQMERVLEDFTEETYAEAYEEPEKMSLWEREPVQREEERRRPMVSRPQPMYVGERIKYNAPAHEKSRLGDTGVLFENADRDFQLILVSKNPMQKDSIVLEKDSYVVGKLQGQADIVLKHPSVSRVHAKIDRLGNEYYLCDLNSTNGTFLNGRRLMVNESVKLTHSDEIAFAREAFQVVSG